MQKTIHQVNPSRSGLYRLNYQGKIYFGRPTDKDKIIVTLERVVNPCTDFKNYYKPWKIKHYDSKICITWITDIKFGNGISHPRRKKKTTKRMGVFN
jgi:hypothetical protein